MVFRKIAIWITLFLTSANWLYGQTTLRGQLVKNGQPASYATIATKDYNHGTYSDEKGFFELFIPNNYDSVMIESLVSETKMVAIEELNNGIIDLDYSAIDLPISTKKANSDFESEKIGSKLKKPHSIMVFNDRVWSQQFGRLLDFSKDSGFLQNVSVYIAKTGVRTTPFRLRFFSIATIDGIRQPYEEITPADIVVKGPRKGKWVEKDICEYHIPVSNEGIFIGIEWIASKNEDFYYYSNLYRIEDGKTIRYKEKMWGGSFGMEDILEEKGCWIRQNNKKWIYQVWDHEEWKLNQPMIKATVLY